MALTTPNWAIGPGHLSELQVFVNNVEIAYQELPLYVSVDPIATWQYKLPFSFHRPLTLTFKPSIKYAGPNQFSANIMRCQTDQLMHQTKSLAIDKAMRDLLPYFWTFSAASSLSLLASLSLLRRRHRHPGPPKPARPPQALDWL